MILNILGTVAVMLASLSTEPRDSADVWVKIVSVSIILAAIWI